MKRCAVLLLLVSAGFVHAEDKAKDKERLPGAWLVVGLELDGRDEPIQDQKIRFVFTADKVSILTPKKENDLEFSWQLDESTTPRILDLTGTRGAQKDQVFEGIYKFDGNTLIFCVRGPQGLRERPTEFASKQGSNLFVIKLEKMK
jgi:uncharacterized protein (TIGR03067 family)